MDRPAVRRPDRVAAEAPSASSRLLQRDDIYQREVFFVRPLGLIEPTAARRISYADSLEFERFHERAYAELGYPLVDVPAMPVDERAAQLLGHLR